MENKVIRLSDDQEVDIRLLGYQVRVAGFYP
jgi:hypothetical protein